MTVSSTHGISNFFVGASKFVETNVSSFFRNAKTFGSSLAPKVAKVESVALSILRSPFFQGGLLGGLGLATVILAAKNIYNLKQAKTAQWKPYVEQVAFLVAGVALIAVAAVILK